ncbi:MAG: hypothetical protein EPO28_07955 [Saprospiraceae bacterium]|nr:MAG: hypothetical protein EPO28_07955 [Saprospiraceae bacterium]
MTIFDQIFGNSKPATPAPKIRFGRFSDSYHLAAQDAAFDEAVQAFSRGDFVDSYKAFFDYLHNAGEENVRVWREKEDIGFELFQGSKKVTGFANGRKFYAVAIVARANSLQSSFMRRLLDENFELKYSRFALTPANEIAIVFDSYPVDSSPYKLYAALKELATHADKHDDLLIDEFDALEPTDINIRRHLPQAEKETKYRYIKREIETDFGILDNGKLHPGQYATGFTYLLLYLCYKLDYLTKPEGYMMETLERIHRLAFAKDGKNVAQKNLTIRKEFQKLLDRPQEKFFKEMYEVRSTFGITTPIDHEKLALIIGQELPNMKWYLEQGHEQIALAVPGYIVSFSLFYYALPAPDKEFFHLLLQIIEHTYFDELGFRSFVRNGRLEKKAICHEISGITERHCKACPHMQPDVKMLVWNSLPQFAESYLHMVRTLDLSGCA